MKVLFVAEYFPPVAPGGAEWSIYHLADALVKRGHEVGLATVNHGPTPKAPEGVTVFAMPFPSHLKAGQTIHRQGVLENPLFHFAFSIFLFSVLRRYQPDLIHSQTKNSLVAAALSSKISGIPFVHTIRDIGIACPFGMCFINGGDVEKCSLGRCAAGSCSAYFVKNYTPGRLYDWINIRVRAALLWPDSVLKQWCVRNAYRRISPSRGLLQSLPARIRMEESDWKIIPHLPPPQESLSSAPVNPFAGKGRYVLYLGKYSLGKGVKVLEDAIERLSSSHPDVTFVFAGKGAWTFRPGLPIQDLGSVSYAQAQGLISGADCVVVPSIVPEAFNRVVLEAMAQKSPVVTTDAGSLPDQVIDGETGYVAARGSAEALTEALHMILSDSEKAREMGRKGWERSQNRFSPEATLRDIEAIYSECDLRSDSVRWSVLNAPIKAFLIALGHFNDKAKRLAMSLVKWTGKSSQRVHPKHLMAKEDFYSWYVPHLRVEDDVLDIGSGVGTHAFTAAARCRSAVGIEYDPVNLKIATELAKKNGLPNVRFLDGNVEQRLPFQDGSFDVVLLLDVLEHLNKRDAALTEMNRVLRPGGRLMVTIPNRVTPLKNTLKAAGLFYYADRDHKIEYRTHEIREELARNGFVVRKPMETVVADTFWVGAIDIIGGLSLSLYRKLSLWKVEKAKRHPETSNGFLIVAEKEVGTAQSTAKEGLADVRS